MEALRRIVVIGPECSGKTTLAAALGEALGAPVVPEAARLFAERHGTLSAATVAPIARLSIQLEQEAAARGPLIVRDTDLVSTVVYSRHYYGHVEPWIVEAAAARRADLYLLCRPDLPWTPDGVRDRPLHRQELFDAFAAELAHMAAAVTVIGGVGDARTLAALDAVRAAGLSAPRAASS